MNVLNLRAALEVSAGRAFNGLVAGLLLSLLIACLLRVMRHHNPGTRFAVWFTALLSTAILPVLSVFVPGAHHETAAIAIVERTPLTLPGGWAFALFGIWAALSAIALSRVLIGLWELGRLRDSCCKVDVVAHPALADVMRQRSRGRDVAICTSDRVSTPTALGLLRPAVVLPSWVLEELSAEELKSVVLHELAHLSRGDDWTNLVQKLIKAVLFFHPAVWWIERQLNLEREMACDGAVLAANANPRLYAQCLVSLAERSFGRRGVVLAQAAVSRLHQLSSRVKRVLDIDREPGTKIAKPAVASAVVLSAVGFVALAGAPQIVAFRDVQRGGTAASLRPSEPAQRFVRNAAATPVIRASFRVPERARTSTAKESLRTAPALTTVSQVKQGSSPRRQQASVREARLVVKKEATRTVETTAPNIFLVVETTQYDAFGGANSWTLQIVQFTVFHPAKKPAQNPAKSI